LLRPSSEVADAIASRRPVVALESTLITHGLPPPHNLEAATRAETVVRAAGAVPATVALRDGLIRVGLTRDELNALAAAERPEKVSTRDLAASLGRAGWSGTTVSATMIAAHRSGIRLFATGGIGGVHRGGEVSLDVSTDLAELARTPVAVVCAGPKSILDVARTLEVLESWGVPVVGWGTDEVAGFFTRSSGSSARTRVDGAAEAAELVSRQWALGLGGVLFCVPLPEDQALPRAEAEAAIAAALRDADAAGIHGPANTPFVLGRVSELTEGRSVVANLALIEQNAAVAADIAVAFSELVRSGAPQTVP
jgi:pseudouridylate synthase